MKKYLKLVIFTLFSVGLIGLPFGIKYYSDNSVRWAYEDFIEETSVRLVDNEEEYKEIISGLVTEENKEVVEDLTVITENKLSNCKLSEKLSQLEVEHEKYEKGEEIAYPVESGTNCSKEIIVKSVEKKHIKSLLN